jgi:hypothetical protein
MKNDYSKGGMKIADVECLDRSLKLKQFIKANKSKHPISRIQYLIMSKSNNDKCITQEYPSISEDESICKSAQDTLNTLIDYNREIYKTIWEVEYEGNKNLIDEVSSINLKTFLKKRIKYLYYT